MKAEHKPLFPMFIVSKGRANQRITMRALDRQKQPYRVIIEKDDYSAYREFFNEDQLLILPEKYKEEYETFWSRDEVAGRTGAGAARNFAWDVSVSEGFSHHWVMDDNIQNFHRLNRNIKFDCATPSMWRAMEDFSLRYENLYISGPNYSSFCKRNDKLPPYVLNTRIYSCLLIRNDTPFRWRGTYNEDTDLALRVLKSGGCTVQFNAFLQDKVTTQRVSGGNTEEFYAHEGTKPKSQMLADMHPDCAKVVWKFNRWHHDVDYKRFGQQLVYRDDYVRDEVTNEYGMKHVVLDNKTGEVINK